MLKLMGQKRTLAVAAIAVALGLALSGPAAARRHDPEKLPVTRIRDLHYGDVLFYFYQDEDFEAITRLTAYQQWNLIPHHEDEGQLLLGGLYLASDVAHVAPASIQRDFGVGLQVVIPRGISRAAEA